MLKAGGLKDIETILLKLGHDPKAAAAGWRSVDPLVVAILFAIYGYPVFPCNKFKVPVTAHGVLDAMCHLPTIFYWARDNAVCGWCVKTGRYEGTSGPAGLWGFDIDGALGYARLAELQKTLSPLPPTWTTISGRRGDGGGEHRLYAPAGYGPDMKSVGPALILGKRQKIDQRGRGGYLVIAGSLHKSRNRYRWADGCAPDETPLASLPPEWVEAIDKAGIAPGTNSTAIRSRKSMTPPQLSAADRGEMLIGDAPGHSGFNDPIYKNAIIYFFKAGVEAPAEIIIDTLRELVIEAPKGHGRDVSRYLSGPDLARIVERAREFVKSVKEEESVELE